jgi:hypothetical protein
MTTCKFSFIEITLQSQAGHEKLTNVEYGTSTDQIYLEHVASEENRVFRKLEYTKL